MKAKWISNLQIFFLILLPFTPTLIKAQEAKESPPIQEIEALICPDFNKFFNSSHNLYTLKCEPQVFRTVSIQLNSKKTPSWIFTLKNVDLCGNHANCPFWIIEKNKNEYRVLISYFGTSRLSKLKSKHLGYADLLVYGGNNAAEYSLSKLVWDGKNYKKNLSMNCRLSNNKNSFCRTEGEVLFDHSEASY